MVRKGYNHPAIIMQKYLYHASPIKDLAKLEPRANTTPAEFEEGPCVFATDNLPFATEFLVPHDDSWANGGAFSGTNFFVIGDKERFREVDKGGCIYIVHSLGFRKYNKREWLCKEPVDVVEKIVFTSGLTAMIIHGVQVYFVDNQVYSNIQNARDHGLTILNSLESENEKLGFPVEELGMYRGSKKNNLR